MLLIYLQMEKKRRQQAQLLSSGPLFVISDVAQKKSIEQL